MAFEIRVRDADDHTSVVALDGDVDLAAAPNVKWTLMDLTRSGRTRLVVDLSAVSFIDSTGLGVLVGVKRALGGTGRVAVACAPPSAHKLFEVTGLASSFGMFRTVDTALAYVRGEVPGPPAVTTQAET